MTGHVALLLMEHGKEGDGQTVEKQQEFNHGHHEREGPGLQGRRCVSSSYRSLAQVVKAKAMCVLKDASVETAVKPWLCKCI